MLLRISNLKAGYPDHKVLYGINLAIEKNQIVAMLGVNGCGKSTLLKAIVGQTASRKGAIIFEDTDIINFSTHQIVALGIGFLPQGHQIFPNMTVLENLHVGSRLMSHKFNATISIDFIFRKFPFLEKFSHKKAGLLSGGQQQILAITMALISKPRLLLLDEPTMGLSATASESIFEIITDLKKNGTTVILAEQNVEFATKLADKIYFLENGLIKT